MVAVTQWRYSSSVLATFVVALGNISLFLGVALAQGNLKETVSDECAIANIKQYVAQIEKTYSSELASKLKKCAAVAVPWLIEQTEVDNADTQVTAISLLAMIGTPASSAIPRLIELLQSSQNEDLRILAAGTLPKVASSENLKSIISILTSTLKDKNQDVRFRSAVALVDLQKNDNNLSISGDTANALRKVIDKDVVPNLIEAFQDYEDSFVATDALVQIGRAIPALIHALQDNNVYVRFSAAEALGRVGKDAKDAIPYLIFALKDKNEFVRYAAAVAFARIDKDKDAVPTLIYALKDKEVWVRIYAAEALSEIGKDAKDAVPALIFALKDKDYSVRIYAAGALSEIGKDAKNAVPALIFALKDKDYSVRTYAAKALGQIGKDAKDAVPVLISALKDSNYGVRTYAAEALGEIGKDAKVAIPVLISALKDKNSVDLPSFAKALRKIGKDPIPDLIVALKDEDKLFRYAASEALGAIGKDAKDALPALISALKDKEVLVQQSAAKALGKIGKDAIPALIFVLKYEDNPLRLEAAEALIEIGKDGKLDELYPLIFLLKHRDRYIREVAALALSRINKDTETTQEIITILDTILRDSQGGETAIAAIEALENINSPEANLILTKYRTLVNNIRWQARRSDISYVDIPSIRKEAMIFALKNSPKSCNNSLVKIILGWKCFNR